MSETLKPDTPEQLIDTLAWANSEEIPLSLVGHGSKSAMGRPVQSAYTLDLSGFTGIDLYEKAELVLRAGAATPMAEIEAALEKNGQELAFEPPNLSRLFGRGDADAGTIGGIISGNLAGPRRIKAGAARDHFLGFEAVSGRGQAFKSGGRVMKNVTGYDLPKLLCGSWGTLAAMTSITMKVLPASEKTRTILVRGVDAAIGVKALSDALNSPYEASAAAWIPKSVAGRSAISYVSGADDDMAAIRVEGFGPSVEYRGERLRDALSRYGATEELHTHNSRIFWTELRDVHPFAGGNGNGSGSETRCVWRLSVPPTDGPHVLSKLLQLPGAEGYLDWGGGLIWLAVDDGRAGHDEGSSGGDAQSVAVRAALVKTGGHASLIRAPAPTRAAVPVFQPQDGPFAALTRRIKDGFDPNGILNPGRMYEGI